MTTAMKERAPEQTGQDLNEPQPDMPDEPGRAIGYAIYHPDHGFAETCTSAIDDFTDHQNEGHAILLFRYRDVAAADRLQRGWSDEATIIPVRIPESGDREEIQVDGDEAMACIVDSVKRELEGQPAQLYALRRPDGIWHGWPTRETEAGESLYQVECFRTADEAASERHFAQKPHLEIVPLVEATDETHLSTDPHAVASRLYKQVQVARNWFERFGLDHQAEEPCAPIVEKLEAALSDWGSFFITLADRSKGSTD